MNPKLINYLCDPIDNTELNLHDANYDDSGQILSGCLISASGNKYFIKDGIPRFVHSESLKKTVDSFGDEWNVFNFDMHKLNWIEHTVKNTFGSTDIFRDKVVVDAGAGSGMQSKWIYESGANYVISLELSHSVDQIMKSNLKELLKNVDIVQCSIDMPPIKPGSINGIVYCHNVIQHTPSVMRTAKALWNLIGDGGELVFNCYPKNDQGAFRKLRLLLNNKLRSFMKHRSFNFIRNYARTMSIIRFVPFLGIFLEKSNIMFRGDVPKGPNYIKRAYLSGVLNTFDWFGTHEYQHYTSNEELKKLVNNLQPNKDKVLNTNEYFTRPQPIGIALRLIK